MNWLDAQRFSMRQIRMRSLLFIVTEV
jgi:hypothetical protein